jgi:hypothetical protein
MHEINQRRIQMKTKQRLNPANSESKLSVQSTNENKQYYRHCTDSLEINSLMLLTQNIIVR